MRTPMIGKNSLFGIAASTFIIWHSLALTFAGPGPNSHLHNKLKAWYEPYLKFFHLDSKWAFYAPDPSYGSLLHYEVLTADGITEYELTEKHHKIDPAYFRYTAFYNNLLYDDEPSQGYQKSIARHLCARHENAQRVKLIVYHQTKLTAQMYNAGHRPLDREQLKRETLGNGVQCLEQNAPNT